MAAVAAVNYSDELRPVRSPSGVAETRTRLRSNVEGRDRRLDIAACCGRPRAQDWVGRCQSEFQDVSETAPTAAPLKIMYSAPPSLKLLLPLLCSARLNYAVCVRPR